MLFVWDAAKDRSNKAKHGVSFETAKLAFDDPLQLSILDGYVDGEERWRTLGLVGSVTLLLVIHTYVDNDGEEIIRIISARKATRHERSQYEYGP